MNGVIVAVISTQALILPQNHLKINTKPSPAPHSMINFHTPDILSICVETNRLKRAKIHRSHLLF